MPPVAFIMCGPFLSPLVRPDPAAMLAGTSHFKVFMEMHSKGIKG